MSAVQTLTQIAAVPQRLDVEVEDFSKHQDVIGQFIIIRTYMHIALGFKLPKNYSQETISRELRRACGDLTAAFPWLAGHVVTEGAGPDSCGVVTIAPYPPGGRGSVLVTKDISRTYPSFDKVVAAGVPMSMLDGDVLTDKKGLGQPCDEASQRVPVTEIQANFLEGGMIISFATHHSIMDMNGQGHFMQMLAKRLHGQPLTEQEIAHGNRDRRAAIRMLRSDEMEPDVRKKFLVDGPLLPPMEEGAVSKWAYFHFSGAKLAELKALVAKSKASPASWASTNDVLTAFVFQHVLAARIKRRGAPKDGTAMLVRAVNARRFIETPLPVEYMGNVVFPVLTKVPLDSPKATSDLAGLSFECRSDLQNLSTNDVHSFVTTLAHEKDKSQITFAPNFNPFSYDMLLSSWSGIGILQTDFGSTLGGKPVFGKYQNFAPFEGVGFLMPITDAGDVDLAICLRVEDIETLKGDAEFLKYAKYVG